ncbi:MAG: hypothetical protein FJX76_04720 [Armatimonadetes bacterium]|nr:hypothetical protein [Armatimonadota bacterium]
MVSINNNPGNMRSQDALAQSHRVLQVSLERLSTGIRINRAEDDAAGVMVRDRFQAQMNGFEEAVRNIQAGQSMIQVAEQGLNKITEGLQQMRALAVRAADDNLNDDDRFRIQQQVKGLLREINERAQRTIYNGHNLLNGSIADSHDARDGFTKIQTNSFLANSTKLITGSQTTGNSATTPNGISQGSYQVKLVYDANHRDDPIATTLTTLAGTASSGHAYLNSTTSPVTVTQAIFDRDGNSHDVNVTFANTGANTWEYVMTSGAGGLWTNPINVTGTVAFNASGEFNGVNVTGGSTTATASGALVNVQIADGTGSGQMWAVDFSRLRESDESVVVNPRISRQTVWPARKRPTPPSPERSPRPRSRARWTAPRRRLSTAPGCPTR